jgi:hypothetical protein
MYEEKYLKYKDKYLELKKQIGGYHFSPGANVIIDRKRIARISYVRKNHDGSYIYNIFYLDNPSETLDNIKDDRIILLPKNIKDVKYKIFQPFELITRKSDGKNFMIVKIRNTGGESEIYEAEEQSRRIGDKVSILIDRKDFKSENPADPRQ